MPLHQSCVLVQRPSTPVGRRASPFATSGYRVGDSVRRERQPAGTGLELVAEQVKAIRGAVDAGPKRQTWPRRRVRRRRNARRTSDGQRSAR